MYPQTEEQAKGAYCPDCGGWMLLSCMPHAEIDKDSRREFGRAAQAGYIIRILSLAESHAPGYCKCGYGSKKKATAQTELFPA